MKIAIGCDHGGIVLKEAVLGVLKEQGAEALDCGCRAGESVDYPDYARKVAEAVATGAADRGIVLCGTGIGIAIAANKVRGIRAAVVHDAFTAEMCARHNDANVLALGGRVLTPEAAAQYTRIWLETPFEGGRHVGRLDKIARIEDKYFK